MIITIDKINVMRYCFPVWSEVSLTKKQKEYSIAIFHASCRPIFNVPLGWNLKSWTLLRCCKIYVFHPLTNWKNCRVMGPTGIVCVLTNGGISVLSGTRATPIMRYTQVAHKMWILNW